jgi:hypothetical protein
LDVVWAHPGRLRTLGVFHRKNALHGIFFMGRAGRLTARTGGLLPGQSARRSTFNQWDMNGNGGLSLAEIDKAMVADYPEYDHEPAL